MNTIFVPLASHSDFNSRMRFVTSADSRAEPFCFMYLAAMVSNPGNNRRFTTARNAFRLAKKTLKCSKATSDAALALR